MTSLPLVSVVMIALVTAGASFGAGFLIGHQPVGSIGSDPYRYCYHVDLTRNSSFIPEPIRPFAPPGLYAICKVA